RWMGGQTHINVTSVWFVAGVTMLDPGWVALLAAGLYLHLWLRVWRHVRNRPAHRVAASAAWMVLSCYLASFTLRASGLGRLSRAEPLTVRGTWIVLTAGGTFEVVSLLLVSMGIYLYTHKRSLSDMIGSGSDNALELVTLCLGGLTGIALVYQPFLVALVFPPLLLLHRNVLVKQLEEAATKDEKLGIYNFIGWQTIAKRELERTLRTSGPPIGVLMVDLDHFKKVNDVYGHLAGDAVLKAVAATISGQIRNYDSVGRFGGEEFVVLLPGVSESEAVAAAERIRVAVTGIEVTEEADLISGLSVSIGVALYPAAGNVVEKLIGAADAALYRAKNGGRNQVVKADDPKGTRSR
ncbi:MAG TPA: GGDEF domain-containing protein, partial [Pseudonocardiaceae bacterium]|nr:GGDEF domain-containing protein [Pseudonocardiaceae bacterium]